MCEQTRLRSGVMNEVKVLCDAVHWCKNSASSYLTPLRQYQNVYTGKRHVHMGAIYTQVNDKYTGERHVQQLTDMYTSKCHVHS